MKLKNKTILITGASSGIGRAMAIKSAKDGATVILASRNKEKLIEVKKEVESCGGKGIVIQTDVTKAEEVRNLFLEATKNERIIDVVFNNAGLGFIANIYELTTDEIESVVDTNVKGAIFVSKFASEVLVRQKHGHLIITSSLAGLITLPQWSVYVASKWAITAFADSIRPELKPFNVKVTTLHPGAVTTEFFDKEKADVDIAKIGEAISPEEVVDAVYEALFTDKKKIKIPSMTKSYSLLYKYLPGLVEKMIEKMTGELEYHDRVEEDEPEFSYVKSVE